MKNILVTLAILACASFSFADTEVSSLAEVAKAIHQSSASKLITITMSTFGASMVEADSSHAYYVKSVWIGIEAATNALCDLGKQWTHAGSGSYSNESIACIAK
jgi:hypothetical protein